MKPINCPECGYLIQDHSNYCKMCGCKIERPSQTGDEEEGKPQNTQPSASVHSGTIRSGGQNFPVNSAASQNHGQVPHNAPIPPYAGNIPRPVPVNAPQSMPQNMPQSMPQNMPQSMPQSMPQNMPQNMPQSIPQGMPQSMPQNMQQGMPQNSPAQFQRNYPAAGGFPAYQPRPKKAGSSGKKTWIILLSVIGGILLVLGISLSAVYFTGPERKYNSACSALEAQRFDEAYDGFIALGTYKDSKAKASEAMYKKGVYLVKNENYKDAATIFKSLNDYQDSSEQYVSAYYNYGMQLMGDGAYLDAADVFTSLGSYSDSELMVYEAKYCYVINHMDNSDTTTYRFLNELISIRYKDCKALYKTLYAWKATDFYFNTGRDSSDKKNSISKNSPLYCHFTIDGGPPDGSFYAYAVAFWPDGSKMNKQKSAVVMYKGGTFWWGWKDGIYINPKNGKTGTFTLILYDEDSNEIGRSSVKITK